VPLRRAARSSTLHHCSATAAAAAAAALLLLRLLLLRLLLLRLPRPAAAVRACFCFCDIIITASKVPSCALSPSRDQCSTVPWFAIPFSSSTSHRYAPLAL
jgi:hypothetical protein